MTIKRFSYFSKFLIPVIFILGLTTTAVSQEKEKVVYENGKVFMLAAKEGTFDFVNKVPLGKDATVIKKPFFKKYTLLYVDENEKVASVHFSFVQEMKDGTIKLRDRHDSYYYATDKLRSGEQIYFKVDKNKLSKENQKYDAYIVVDFGNNL